MKIAICTSWESARDGIADCSASFVPFLRKAVEVEIIPLQANVSSSVFYRERAVAAGRCSLCHVQHNYVLFNGLIPWRQRFTEFLRRVPVPLLITFHEYRGRYPAAPLPTGRGLPSLARRFRRLILNHSELLGMRAWLRHYHRLAFHRADLIHVHTERHRRLLIGMGGSEERIRVFPLPVPPHAPPVAVFGAAEAKRRLGWEGKRILLTPGFVNPRKGYEEMISVVADLPPDVSYVIAGGAMNEIHEEYQRALRSRLLREGLGKRVVVSGYVPFELLSTMLSAADLVVAPYPDLVQGSASLALALGFGKAILASDVAVHREAVSRVPCLELYDPEFPGDLRRRLFALLDDPARRQALERGAREYQRRFGPGQYAGYLLGLYREVSG